MQLLLIRHASNDWIASRLAGWTPGVHLNDAGRAEAARLAGRLSAHRLDAVYASPLERAVETAAFVAAPHGLAVQVVEEVGEVRFGSWEGQDLAALREDPLWASVQSYPSGTRFPGGETLGEVQNRALAAIDRIREASGDGVVAIVSHGDVIRTVVAHYVGVHIDTFQRLVVAPASLSVLALGVRGPRLLLFNDVGTIPLPAESTTTGPGADSAKPGASAGAGASGAGS